MLQLLYSSAKGVVLCCAVPCCYNTTFVWRAHARVHCSMLCAYGNACVSMSTAVCLQYAMVVMHLMHWPMISAVVIPAAGKFDLVPVASMGATLCELHWRADCSWPLTHCWLLLAAMASTVLHKSPVLALSSETLDREACSRMHFRTSACDSAMHRLVAVCRTAMEALVDCYENLLAMQWPQALTESVCAASS